MKLHRTFLALLLAALILNAYLAWGNMREIAETNRISRTRTEIFREWSATFKRIEGRQVIFMSTIRGDISPEQWAKIEEINRGMEATR